MFRSLLRVGSSLAALSGVINVAVFANPAQAAALCYSVQSVSTTTVVPNGSVSSFWYYPGNVVGHMYQNTSGSGYDYWMNEESGRWLVPYEVIISRNDATVSQTTGGAMVLVLAC